MTVPFPSPEISRCQSISSEHHGQGSHLQQYLLQGVGRCPAFKNPHSKDRPGGMFSNYVVWGVNKLVVDSGMSQRI